ncbi:MULTISPECIES: hypothetical protein [unclassified Microbacterium]|uniref:hypothetical protein n=1 Tax=unclassified Microbacterium TaxID=2609290 RepID=UPI0030159516
MGMWKRRAEKLARAERKLAELGWWPQLDGTYRAGPGASEGMADEREVRSKTLVSVLRAFGAEEYRTLFGYDVDRFWRDVVSGEAAQKAIAADRVLANMKEKMVELSKAGANVQV